LRLEVVGVAVTDRWVQVVVAVMGLLQVGKLVVHLAIQPYYSYLWAVAAAEE